MLRASVLTLVLLALAAESQAAGRILLGATKAEGTKESKAAVSKAEADQYPGFGAGRQYGGGGGGNGRWGNGNWGGDNDVFGPTALGGGGSRLRGLTGGRGRRGWRQGGQGAQGGNPYRRYDRTYLNGLVPNSPPRWSGGAARPIGGDALRFSQSFGGASADGSTLGRDMVRGRWRSDVAAEAIVDAAASGRGDTVGDAMASAAALDRSATAQVFARSANFAMMRGQTGAFADATADAFVESRRRGSIKNFGLAMADAVNTGGQYGQYTYGQGIAKALAQGGDGQQAVAEATAEVFCNGNDYASAWSSAFAVALSEDENGCLVLSRARAMALASCGGGAFNSYSDSDATSQVLGFCGLFPPGAGPDFSFSTGDSGSNTWNGRK